MLINFDNLPPEDKVEAIVSEMNKQEAIEHLAIGQSLLNDKEQAEKYNTLAMNRTLLMIVRRHRVLRETSKGKGGGKKADSKPEVKAASVDELFKGL